MVEDSAAALLVPFFAIFGGRDSVSACASEVADRPTCGSYVGPALAAPAQHGHAAAPSATPSSPRGAARRWPPKHAVSEQRLDWMLATLLEKITERGGSVSNRVKTLLTRFDLDNSGELEMDEFRSLPRRLPRRACRTASSRRWRSASTATGPGSVSPSPSSRRN